MHLPVAQTDNLLFHITCGVCSIRIYIKAPIKGLNSILRSVSESLVMSIKLMKEIRLKYSN